MKWVVIVVRTLVGALFVFAGGAYFFMPEMKPTGEVPKAVLAFADAFHPTHWMTVVKVVELVGGLLLLTGRLAPPGITLLTPVAVNIALFEVLLARDPGPGVVTTLALGFLIWAYWPYFAPVFTTSARVRGA